MKIDNESSSKPLEPGLDYTLIYFFSVTLAVVVGFMLGGIFFLRCY